jgi:hypothetical protein
MIVTKCGLLHQSRRSLFVSYWVLDCPSCHQQFIWSEVTPLHQGATFLDAVSWPLKPQWAAQGMDVKCAKCGIISIYQRNQLRYVKPKAGFS